VNRTDTGVNVGALDVFSYSVDVSPLTLPPTFAHWLSIFNDTSSTWLWGSTTRAGGNSVIFFSGAWSSPISFALDFELTGPDAVVPEPSTLALLIGGAAALLFAAIPTARWRMRR
jgi:hypothetical protein